MHTEICKQGNKVHFACNCKPDPRCNLRYKLLPETPFLHSNELDIGQHVVILHICWCEGASSYISAEAANEWVCVWVIVEDQQIFFLVNIFFILVSKTLVPILIWHVVIIITLFPLVKVWAPPPCCWSVFKQGSCPIHTTCNSEPFQSRHRHHQTHHSQNFPWS